MSCCEQRILATPGEVIGSSRTSLTRVAASAPLVVPGLLLVLCLGIYGIALPGPYLLDDFAIGLTDGPLGNDRAVPVMIGSNRWVGFASFWLNGWVFGRTPASYRGVNIAIHFGSAWLLYELTRRTLARAGNELRTDFSPEALGLALAVLWLCHPLETSAVTYIVQRFESLMALFFLLTFYGTLRGSQSSRPALWYALAVIACWLGAGTKEVMLACPLLLLLYDRVFLAGSWREVVRQRGWLHATTFAAAGWLVWAVRSTFVEGAGSTTAGFGFRGVTAWEYLRSQPGVLLHYLQLVVWPRRLVMDYGWPVAESPLEIYGFGLIIVGMLGATLWALIRRPRLGFLGACFFTILGPTSSVVPIRDLAFEHRMYLPLAPLLLLAILVAARLLSLTVTDARWRRRVALVSLVLVAALFAGRTLARNFDYRDAARLYSIDVICNPRNTRALNNLATILQRAKKYEAAIAVLNRALEQNHNLPTSWLNLGLCYAHQGDDAAAAPPLETALSLAPHNEVIRRNLSLVRMRQADYRSAIEVCRPASGQTPRSDGLRQQLAWLLAVAPDPELRNPELALELCGAAIERPEAARPGWLDAAAAAHAQRGEFEQAVRLMRIAARHAEGRVKAEMARRLDRYQRGETFELKRSMERSSDRDESHDSA